MKSVIVIIPAFNEEETIGEVVGQLLATKSSCAEIQEVVVVDNGSTDNTAERARSGGARVVEEAQRGYGSACLAGIKFAEGADILCFIDGDGSDLPEEWPLVVDPVSAGEVECVIGSRVSGKAEQGALSFHQRFGNWLACFLIKLFHRTHFSDLGPFRAISAEALQQLKMDDRDFGWTVQMQLELLRQNVSWKEVAVSYRNRRGGVSKISGSLRGSYLAGKKIIGLILKDGYRRYSQGV